MNDLRITLVQAPLVWEDRRANRDYFTTKLTPLAGETDLIVLPEMFTTGFTMQPGPVAETMQGPTLKWLQIQAARLRAAVTGSFVVEENGRHYNRLVFVHPNSSFQYYDKRHPFTMSGEHEQYARGEERLIVDYRGWRICPLICYDLRFPVWSRNLVADRYDLLLYVANWPDKRAYDWRTLLRARAIENQAYVVGVNRIGTDAHNLNYSGDSCAIDPGPGRDLFDAGSAEVVRTVTLSATSLERLRRGLPFLQDGDSFTLQ